MTDLEGITKRLLTQKKAKDEILARLIAEYGIFKTLPESELLRRAQAIYDECETTQKFAFDPKDPNGQFVKTLLSVPISHWTMGDGGVGCRGQGDFIVHRLLTQLSKTSITPYLSPSALDDCGAVQWVYNRQNEKSPLIILSKMEGMHSRLSDFPFLAGFHVTRAALRDIYVKGGIPISIMVDVHLADDGDIGKLFDFQAGIATVADLAKVPITAGSTLRIGGDMVIGDRLTGGIAAVGIMQYPFLRSKIRAGDSIIMTQGAGGGTITTTALYHGKPDVVLETMNLSFIHACRLLFQQSELCAHIHAMLDVTNGGLRGDLAELQTGAPIGVRIELEKVERCVDPRVLQLLKQTHVDYLGVSLDALLIICEPAFGDAIQQYLVHSGIKVECIGVVREEPGLIFISPQGEILIQPRFREAAYTPIKTIVDRPPEHFADFEKAVTTCCSEAEKKKQQIITFLRQKEK